MKRDQRLRNLAGKLDAMALADDARIARAEEIAGKRKEGARRLHALCHEVVQELNPLLTRLHLELSPDEFTNSVFQDPGKNVFQINIRGRIVQITFEATETDTSTENFRMPYILYGAIRWYSQERLERDEMGEQWIFCCLDRGGINWQVVEPRSRRNALLDADYLTSVLEQLV